MRTCVVRGAVIMAVVGAVLLWAHRASSQASPAPVQVTSYTDWAINELSRRVTNLEEARFDSRISVLEDSVAEIKLLTRAVTGAAIAQCFAVIFMWRRRRDRG